MSTFGGPSFLTYLMQISYVNPTLTADGGLVPLVRTSPSLLFLSEGTADPSLEFHSLHKQRDIAFVVAIYDLPLWPEGHSYCMFSQLYEFQSNFWKSGGLSAYISFQHDVEGEVSI